MMSLQKGVKNSERGAVQTKTDDICQVRCFNSERINQVRAILPNNDTLEAAQVLFAALADKSRLKILFALQDGQELCVCDIATLLGVRQPLPRITYASCGT